MPNLASVLKAEISRIARKEGRSETDALKKSVSSQRSDIAALKRRVQALEKSLKALAKAVSNGRPPLASVHAASDGDAEAEGLRFRAKGMASNRKRLGLSAEEFGLLVGASGQSVYSWEAGKTKPRAANLAAIAALRGVGKREAARRLEALKR
ncbi:MAG: helix-turn-helix domain-containing protein [Rubrivivax sp.]|nr:helix-turn-helix domain-containing protein [Rubrivivax sp.]